MNNLWWTEVTDISEDDVLGLVLLYNSMVTQHCLAEVERVKHYIKYKSKNFKKHRHYGDAIKLYRFMSKLELKPREYLNVQFTYYKKEKKHPYCRPVPSLKNLSSPVSFKRWKQWLIDNRQEDMPSIVLTDIELQAYEEAYLLDMLKAWNIPSEIELFKDIVLARSLPIDFLEKRATFRELVEAEYYENTYNVKTYKELFV